MDKKLQELKKDLDKHYKDNSSIYSKENYIKDEIKKIEKKLKQQEEQYDLESKILFTFLVVSFILFVFFLI
jgi:hypothetical protein